MTEERAVMGDRERARRIERQSVLPFTKAAEIAWKGLMIRFWRSMITMSGIILAIAFLMSIWTSTAFVDRLRSLDEQSDDKGMVELLLQKRGIETAGEEAKILVLSNDASGANVEEALRNLLSQNKEFHVVLTPSSVDQIEDELRNVDCVVLQGPTEASADKRFAEKLKAHVEAGGSLLTLGGLTFAKGAGELERASQGIIRQLLPVEPESLPARPVGTGLKASRHIVSSEVEWSTFPPTLALTPARPIKGAKVIVQTADKRPVLAVRKVGKGSVASYLVQDPGLARHLQWPTARTLMTDTLRWLNRDALVTGSSAKAKNWWLVSLSLLVCVVGIVNSMLMSVSERVREIGTMKCLGALDRFIVKLFLLESSFQGFIGTIVGIILGFMLTFVRCLMAYTYHDKVAHQWHFYALRYFPGLKLVSAALLTLVIGALLSIFAAIFPAYRAAKMQPVEAMRVEE